MKFLFLVCAQVILATSVFGAAKEDRINDLELENISLEKEYQRSVSYFNACASSVRVDPSFGEVCQVDFDVAGSSATLNLKRLGSIVIDLSARIRTNEKTISFLKGKK